MSHKWAWGGGLGAGWAPGEPPPGTLVAVLGAQHRLTSQTDLCLPQQTGRCSLGSRRWCTDPLSSPFPLSQPVSFKRRGIIITKQQRRQKKKSTSDSKQGPDGKRRSSASLLLTPREKKKKTQQKNSQTHPSISASQAERAHAPSASQTAQGEIIPWRSPPKMSEGVFMSEGVLHGPG